MNNNLISRKALKEAINTYDKFACLPNGELEPFRNLEHPENFEPYVHLRDILNAIDNIPTVPNEYMRGYEAAEREYKRSRGEWIYDRKSLMIVSPYKCSNCGMHTDDEEDNFCWFCGAKMKGGEENE